MPVDSTLMPCIKALIVLCPVLLALHVPERRIPRARAHIILVEHIIAFL